MRIVREILIILLFGIGALLFLWVCSAVWWLGQRRKWEQHPFFLEREIRFKPPEESGPGYSEEIDGKVKKEMKE